MGEKFRWGILGPGSIARKFAAGLQALPDAELAAVASRAKERADAFADAFGAPRRYGSYEALVRDPDVDAVYVATPHPFHHEHSLLCLKAGKPVLCEKPFTVNARLAREVVRTARETGVFLMEAMWTRFLPVMAQVRDWLKAGAIGETRMLYADFGFRAGLSPEARLFNPRLAGGGLLDVGVYTVSFASMVFGAQPARISGQAHIGETGVDEQAAMVFGYGAGQLALLSCAVRTRTPHEARIMGTDGMITIPSFWNGTSAVLSVGPKNETVERPLEGNGYNYEAAEVMRCVRAGERESRLMPLDESVAVMETVDAVRAQWNLKFPME
jgi:predicted dehydrogenase